jgi:hypothetical protein
VGDSTSLASGMSCKTGLLWTELALDMGLLSDLVVEGLREEDSSADRSLR